MRAKGGNMNIKDFAKTEIHNNKKPNEEDLKKVQNDYGDLVDEFMKRYGKMSQTQMMEEMFKLVKEKKAKGEFNINQIRDVAKTVEPFLDKDAQNYMQQLLKQLED